MCIRDRINYATSLFNKQTIETFIDAYTYLTHQLVEMPDKAYSTLSLLQPKEYDQLIYKWNATDKAYPKNQTIPQLFEEQVKKYPNNIAVVYEEQELTYQQLNEKSNQLARFIRAEYLKKTKKQLQPDTLIPLYICLLYTSPSPRDATLSRMPSSA